MFTFSKRTQEGSKSATMTSLIQTTLWVVHSSVVEKLSVVDKTLPPDNFYLVKALSSGQPSVVDKKSGISMRFCCSLFIMTICCSLACIHLLPFKSHIQSEKLSQVEKWSHSVLSFDESPAYYNSTVTRNSSRRTTWECMKGFTLVKNHSTATTVIRNSSRRTTCLGEATGPPCLGCVTLGITHQGRVTKIFTTITTISRVDTSTNGTRKE